MDEFVQLLDLTSGDVVADFASEHEAIEALIEIRGEYGDQSLAELALLRFRDGHPSLIAMDTGLVRFVANALASRDGQRV